MSQAALEQEKKLRLAERTGRIRADKDKRKAELELLALKQTHGASPDSESALQQDGQGQGQVEEEEEGPDAPLDAQAVQSDSVDSQQGEERVPRSIQQLRKPPAVPNTTYGLKPIGYMKSCFSQRWVWYLDRV